MAGKDNTGILIGDKHTWKDWGLKLLTMVIPMPEPKTNYVDIPGADGTADLTGILGGVRFADREGIEFSFDVGVNYLEWHELTSQIAGYLHGQKMKIIIDSDPNYYYYGRLNLDSQKSDAVLGHLIISGTFEPYKNEILSSLDAWKWDSFSFSKGVIRNYKDIRIEGQKDVRIIGSRRVVIPTITSSTTMMVSFMGKAYYLTPGRNKLYDIAIPDGESILTFTGSGVVSIDYRGGIL